LVRINYVVGVIEYTVAINEATSDYADRAGVPSPFDYRGFRIGESSDPGSANYEPYAYENFNEA
jgi:hypothetical protein